MRLLAARTGAALFGLSILASAPATMAGRDRDVSRILDFAVEVAKKGDWREARFRWEQAAKIDPDNPRILNNLGVAQEVLGEPGKAKEYYDRAVAMSENDPTIVENASRSARFWRNLPAPQGDASRKDEGDHESVPDKPRRGKGSVRVPVKLPLPARLDTSQAKTLLVASFLTNETDLLDTGREIVRFLRGEFRKHSKLEVLDITPPPAIPEQTVPDLIANAEFWKHLGREYHADLIVSGVVHYTRRDASGFEDVDAVSPVTGQKVRQTQFVEQERFSYETEIFFFDGGSGSLLFRDRFQRSALFRGLANDPVTAFYQLSETIAGDVLSVVSPRTREDVRFIFRG